MPVAAGGGEQLAVGDFTAVVDDGEGDYGNLGINGLELTPLLHDRQAGLPADGIVFLGGGFCAGL